MEYSNYYVRSSSIKSSPSPHNSKRFLRSNLIREYKDFQFYDHVKRNLKGTNVNSDSSANNDNANNLITYEHLGESWLELVLPFTILGITVLGVVLVGVILFIWIRKYFSETRSEKCPPKSVGTQRKCGDKLSARKMNSSKWLRGKQKEIERQVVVGDLEQKLETVEFKSSPPTSPNTQKQNDDDKLEPSDESGTEILNEPEDLPDDYEDDDDDGDAVKSNPMILPCAMAIGDFSLPSFVHPQPSGLDEPQVQQATSNSPLSLLQEEVHCVQPREDQTNKIYKSIATSPPPFSPIVHQHSSHKYATTGTQTYFTKAPNSPNNNLLSSAFAVLQTPTTSTVPSGNPFASENKENKEPTKLRTAISNFKQDNGETSSSPSTPTSVISTSPKLATNVLQQQNSPIIPSGDSPPISRQFCYSPKLLTGTNSPTISSANYKFGNYFRFPDVGTPPVPPKIDDKSSSSSSLNKQSSTNTSDESTDVAIKSFQNLSMESDRESIILKIDEVESPAVDVRSPTLMNSYNNNNNNTSSGNTLTIRRARLKSISLDSDGARLVEENLTMPVEELVEIASYNNKQISESEPTDSATSSSANNNNNRYNPKNIYNLTINLDFRDSSLDVTEGSDINMNQDREYDETEDGICRTPTMKYFRNNKKAVSLDSDHQDGGKGAGKTASTETFNYYFGQSHGKMNSSISVPSTPKHLTTNKLKISSCEDRHGRYSRKLGSFEENSDGSRHHMVTTQASQVYKTNLTASIQTLNVSSSNLKTLPEIMSVSDFDGNQSPKPPRAGPPIGIPPSKSGILQRRGSNQSLTLNLDGSCGNLARGLSCSNYSLGNIHGSHLNIAGSNYNHQSRAVTAKKNLLQRRGSNTSLSLNVQESNNNLNRFNSHSSLNIAGSKQQGKGGLLERRNSNASLTLNIQNRGLSISNCNLRGSECSLSSVNTNQMAELMLMEQEAEQEAAKDQENSSRHQRKFLSSENLHNLSIHSRCAMSSGGHHREARDPAPYGSIDNLKHTQPYHEKLPVISTKPLSPQSTSEDFKIYLANIQFLQSASNVLDEEHLRTLNSLFQKSYKTQPRLTPSGQPPAQFNNDDILNNRMGNDGPPISFANASPDEDQKELLIKLHQEFWNLPTNYQEKPMVFGSQPKNRYKTILPNEHSRVILQREDGCQQEPYINANFIKVSPLPTVVEPSLISFFLGSGLHVRRLHRHAGADAEHDLRVLADDPAEHAEGGRTGHPEDRDADGLHRERAAEVRRLLPHRGGRHGDLHQHGRRTGRERGEGALGDDFRPGKGR